MGQSITGDEKLKLNHINTSHRPFPLPKVPWILQQTWDDVLFLHWPVSEAILRDHIPAQLDLDRYEGTAWVSLVLFEVNGMRPRALPPIPFVHSFLELNVRTYVTYKGKPGIYFFSLDANSRLAVRMARIGYSLPYHLAKIELKRKTGKIEFSSSRIHKNKPKESLQTIYRPTAEGYFAKKGTLDYWLTERYCLWTQKGRRLFRTDILHEKWKLQKAEVEIQKNSMAHFLPASSLSSDPVIHYSPSKRVLFWPPLPED